MSSITICLASYAVLVSFLKTLRRGTVSAETALPDQGNWQETYLETQPRRVSAKTDTYDLSCGNSVTMEGNTMAGLCDDPETPLPAEDDPERKAYEVLAKATGGLAMEDLANAAIAQAYATLALVRQIKDLRREVHRLGSVPMMKDKA